MASGTLPYHCLWTQFTVASTNAGCGCIMQKRSHKHDPETLPSSLNQSLFKMELDQKLYWNYMWSFFFLKILYHILWSKNERHHLVFLISTQFKNLHLCWYRGAFVSTDLAAYTSGKAPTMLKGISRWRSFKKDLAYISKTKLNVILHLLQQH